MKTYTCTTCNENFVGKGSYNQHLVSDAHRLEKTVVGSFKLTSAGTFEEFEFKSEAAAVAAAVEFVQLQMKQQEVA